MTNKKLTSLYVEYNGVLISYLKKVGYTKEDAEDISQSVWYKLKDYRIEDVSNIKSFLFSVTQRLGNDIRRKSHIVTDTNKEVIERISNSESMRKWEEAEQSSGIHDKLMEAVCLAAGYTTSFGVSILDIVEDQLTGMTQQNVAEKYGTNRRTVSIELNKWYVKINEFIKQ